MGRKRNKQFLDLEEERYGLFMDNDMFELEIDFGREYLKNDVNYIVNYHKIDVTRSKSHKLYGQTKAENKKFFPPVKLNAMINVDNTTNEFYAEGGAVSQQTGNITMNVYLKELKEKNLEVNRGDIIEYNLSGERPRYYEVEDSQNVADVTSQTLAGFKPYWKKIIATPVNEDVIPFRKEV
ncbi:MAG: hypothetical protein ACOCVF_01625 [bacterium]